MEKKNDLEEFLRLQELEKYQVMDSSAEDAFNALTELAANICDTPIALISLLDDKRQWFKSNLGLSVTETDKNISFCKHAIQGNDLFEVKDAHLDDRFKENPLVQGNPNIRYYAGSPLINQNGYKLGTLCVIDTVPRRLSPHQKKALKTLANEVISQLELRIRKIELQKSFSVLARLNIEIESFIKNVYNDLNNHLGSINKNSSELKSYFDSLETVKKSKYKNLEAISKSSDLIHKILSNSLDFSLGGGKVTEFKYNFLKELIDESIYPFVQNKKLLTLETNIQYPVIYSDKYSCIKAFSALFEASINYSKTKIPFCSIQSFKRNQLVYIYISDNSNNEYKEFLVSLIKNLNSNKLYIENNIKYLSIWNAFRIFLANNAKIKISKDKKTDEDRILLIFNTVDYSKVKV
jgi:hypothetical protein